MATIENVELQSSSQWFTATYVDENEEEYDIVFTKSYDENICYEQKALVNVEKGGETIADDVLWKKIQEDL